MSNLIIRRSITGTIIVLGVSGLRFFIGFGSQLILARLLLPEYFGVMAFSWLVIGFLNILTTLQSSKYLIRTKSEIRTVVNTTFSFELILSVITFLFAVVLAPFILTAVDKSELIPFIQVLSITLITQPFLQLTGLLDRKLNFARSSIPILTGSAVGTLVAIALAINQFGVWSLVLGRLVQFAVHAFTVWIVLPFRPRLELNRKVARELVRFGWPLLGAAILVFFYWNIDYYMVGQLLGAQQLGLYWLAFQMTNYLLELKKSLNKVAYPAFCHVNSQKALVKGYTALSRYTAILFLLPCIILLLYGRSLVANLLGQTWLPSTVPMQILIWATAIRSIFGYWDSVFIKEGKTRILLSSTVLNALLLPVLIYIFIEPMGISGAAMGVLVSLFFVYPYLAFQLKRIVPIAYTKILIRPLIISAICLVTGYLLRNVITIESYIGLIVSMTIIIIIYAALSLIFVPDIKADAKIIVRNAWAK